MAVVVAARRATLLVLIFLVSASLFAADASGEVLESYAFSPPLPSIDVAVCFDASTENSECMRV